MKKRDIVNFDELTVKKEQGLNWYFLPDGTAICGAKNRAGSPCTRPPITGRNRCLNHGGKSLRGLAAPRYKTGQYSRDLAGNFGEKYKEFLGDERLFEMRDEIALAKTFISENLAKIEEGGDTAEAWRELKKVFASLKRSYRNKDFIAIKQDMDAMTTLIESGNREWERWDMLFKAMDSTNKLVSSHHKRMMDDKKVLNAEQANAFVAFILFTIKKHITDPKVLNAISQEISAQYASMK